MGYGMRPHMACGEVHAGVSQIVTFWTRFDAFVLIVTDIGRPTHGHTDGCDGLGLRLNRYVKICMCYRSNSVYTRPGSAYIFAFIYKAQA